MLIPENYVRDLPVRLGLYRRIGALASDAETEAMAAELVDRFGPLPEEVENLLQVVALKRACREAGVEKLEAGPKGMVLTFRGNAFSNPAGLVALAVEQGRPGAAAAGPQAGDRARDGRGDAAALRARYAGRAGADRGAGEGGVGVVVRAAVPCATLPRCSTTPVLLRLLGLWRERSSPPDGYRMYLLNRRPTRSEMTPSA